MSQKTDQDVYALKGEIEALQGAVIYRGQWDADTNTPTLANNGAGGVKGDYYVVSVDGEQNIDGIIDFHVGELMINNGSIWQKVDTYTPPFGTEYQHIDDITETFTDTSAGWNNKIGAFFSVSGAVSYKISWYCEFGNEADNIDASARLTVNGTAIAEVSSSGESNTPIEIWKPFSGSQYRHFTGPATLTVDLQFKTSSTTITERGKCRNAYIDIFRVN